MTKEEIEKLAEEKFKSIITPKGYNITTNLHILFRQAFVDGFIAGVEYELNKFGGYCRKETNGKGRCKELCDRPECGW